MSETTNFRVQLESYRGPLELLLYLVRKHEVDITDIPIKLVTEQFLAHLEVMQSLAVDIDSVGDFLEMASTLLEIKSKMLLPGPEEEAEEIEDPREELVERLLEYKKYKDAASMLEDQSRQWQQRYTRLSNDLPPRKIEISEQPIHEVEMWDLVSAFGRVIRDSQPPAQSNIIYDDTPIATYMKRLHQRIIENGSVSFSEMFKLGMHKSAMIGVFLAILELVRHHSVATKQDELHGEIWVVPGASFNPSLDISNIDNYDPTRLPASGDPASMVS